MLSVPPKAKQLSQQTPAPSIPCRIYRAHSSHPHGEAFLEPEGQPAAADLFPPTAVFEVAVWGEIPRHPRPILQLALVPASSHAGLSSPPIPAGPHPFPGDCSTQGSSGAGFWHRGAQQSPILSQDAVRGACPPRPSFLLPSDHPSSPCQEHGALPRHVPGGLWSPGPAAPGQLLRACGWERAPVLHPRATSAPRQSLGPGPGAGHGRWSRRAVPRRPCPAIAQPAQPGQGAAASETSGTITQTRTTPCHKPFPKVQLCLQTPQPLLSIPSSPSFRSRARCRSQPAAGTGASLRPKASG